MMTAMRYGLGFVVAVSMAVPAMAHPGHGRASAAADGHSVVHYVSEPVHAVGIVGGVLLVAAIVMVVARVRRGSLSS
jgi:hypothetical protein